MTTTGYIEAPDDLEPGQEVKTIYVGARDRFVVSLIVGYSDEDLGSANMPSKRGAAKAASAALQLTRDAGSDDTIWFVHDRATGETFEFEQDDFQDVPIE